MGHKVSVLLTTYNRPEFLRTAIDSVLNQTYRDFELIILDDNSDNEEQKKILLDYWNESRVMIYKSNVKKSERRKKTRYAYLINEGFKISTGDYIAYLCDDDFFYKEKLEKCVNMFKEHQDIFCLYGQQMKRWMDMRTGKLTDKEEIRPADKILEQAAFNIDHSSAIHRREVFEKAGGWDDDGAHWDAGDAVFFNRVQQAGYRFHPINELLDCHVYHDTSWTNGRWQNL